MLINKKIFLQITIVESKERGIILVKMNFMVGTFLISRTKVVTVVSLEGVRIVLFERVGIVLLSSINSISSLKLMSFHDPMSIK